MTGASASGVIGVLWRGQREDRRPSESRGLAALFDAFVELGVEIVPLPFDDTRVDEVRSQCEGLDGLLVWVNPIQDGANRKNVDNLLREASKRGIFVSAHPAVITKMGTKEVLYLTRELPWGSDTDLYRSPEGPDAPGHQPLRRLAEDQWVPQMASILGLDLTDLPVVWDAEQATGSPGARRSHRAWR